MNEKVKYQPWRDKPRPAVGGGVCKGCVDPRKENEMLNIDNLRNRSCRCRCPRSETIIFKAADIDADLSRIDEEVNS
jgi:hypothetical protein